MRSFVLSDFPDLLCACRWSYLSERGARHGQCTVKGGARRVCVSSYLCHGRVLSRTVGSL